MKTIFVLFDTLNRRFLPPYGNDWVHAPNFRRLAERAATFDNCYAGSMPCVPARRELHTGRYNFLHRSWGPLEPFDDSMPQLLSESGVYTHLVSDHQHYWEDGGATYHGRYDSWQFFRGQEGDAWIGQVSDPEIPESLRLTEHPAWRQDWVNRQYLQDEHEHPQTKTFDAGIDFVHRNASADNWFLHLETFDPHEPFFTYKQFRDLYPHEYDGPHFDWPDYKRVTERPEAVEHVRYEYAALVSMCDHSLGRLLDTMDELNLWDDTMLIVGTDHGFLLGEHGWWGKNSPPWYDEMIHTPLFVWDPRSRVAGERRDSLVQTIDFAPTVLDFFDVPAPPDMQGVSLRRTVADDTPIREAALFGTFGAHVNVTDGRHVYMRACADPSNTPLYDYTIMPTRMRGRFTPAELQPAELAEPFSFTKGCRTLRIPARGMETTPLFGTLLFDLHTDPRQERPLVDDQVELTMANRMVELMRANDAPPEQFDRLGLPGTGDVNADHLLARRQRADGERASEPLPDPGDLPSGRFTATTPLEAVLADPAAVATIRAQLPKLLDIPRLSHMGRISLWQLASMTPGVFDGRGLRALLTELARTCPKQ